MNTHAARTIGEIWFAEVLVFVKQISHLLTYALPEEYLAICQIGMRVEVPLGKRHVVGVVMDIQKGVPPCKDVRPIAHLLDKQPLLTKPQLELCQFAATYYVASLSEFVQLCLPKSILKRQKKTKATFHIPPSVQQKTILLTKEQADAIQTIIQNQEQTAFLLQGVTGSGKTQVYIELAKHALKQNRSVLILVPEIALTPQLHARFVENLCEPVLLFHSQITAAQKREAMCALLHKDVRVVVGVRSAIFVPMPDLGLIVVDEEHDSSFKQEENPKYNARDLALWRAKNERATIVLGSATPSLESMHNVHQGKLRQIRLLERVPGSSGMPLVELVDLRDRTKRRLERPKTEGQSMAILTKLLQDGLEKTLSLGEQAILFLNRRGYAAFVLCEACGDIAKCIHCSVSLTYHKAKNHLLCHLCGFLSPIPPFCAACHEGPLMPLGLGTERVCAEVQQRFPKARVERLDRDTMQHPKALKETLERMRNREIDILVGTQAVSKGHDFPHVSLVGVVFADTALALPDFRASERTFQLLTQVAGRAGRGNIPGKVLVQTFNPQHIAIQCAKMHDVERFMSQELNERKRFFQPPFSKAALVLVESTDAAKALQMACQVQGFIKTHLSQSEMTLLGPVEAPIFKMKNRFRYQLYLRVQTATLRTRVLSKLKDHIQQAKWGTSTNHRIGWDIDPIAWL